MSTFTQNIALEKPTNGSSIGTWDVPVNADWDVVDTAIGGTASINVTAASGDVNLTLAQYRCRTLKFTGTLTANVNYVVPSGVGGFWFCQNNSTGAFTITLKSAGGGTTQALAQGYTTSTVCDGTNVGKTDTNPVAGGVSTIATGSTGLLANGVNTAVSGAVALSGTLGIANGGTGATTAAAAINALLPSQGGNNGYFLTTNGTTASWGVISGTGTVTSVAASGGTTGLTFTGSPIITSGTLVLGGTLAVANGGTGGTTQATARSGIGAAASGANTDITSLASNTIVSAFGAAGPDTIGYRSTPQNNQTSSYTLTLTDFAYDIYLSGTTAGQTLTIPANASVAFPVEAFTTITNDTNQSWTIAITSDTLFWSPTGATGSRTLAAGGYATIRKVSATRWWITGTGLT